MFVDLSLSFVYWAVEKAATGILCRTFGCEI